MEPNIVIQAGSVVTLGDPCRVFTPGAVRMEHGIIRAVGIRDDVDTTGAEVIDAGDGVVFPGLINAHTHLYGFLVRGMPQSGPPAGSFRDILERLWWRWDKLLDEEAIRRHAEVGMLESLKNGVTTIVDHHSSPNAIEGSLDIIADCAEQIGIRTSTCYEVSDRDGPDVREAALGENLRFARRLRAEPRPLLAPAIGGHASFTLSDETLARLVAAREESAAPIHIHMDEGIEDGEAARAAGHRTTVRRLADRGILREGTIAAHAVNIESADINVLAEHGVFVTHQPLSNGNNAVGRAPVPALISAGVQVCLGNDGMSGSISAEAMAVMAVHKMIERDMTIPFDLPCRLALGGNAKLAATLFDPPPGEIREGFAGDLVVYGYDPPTEMDGRNVAGHWLLGMLHSPVEKVIVGGRLVIDHGRFQTVDTDEIYAKARESAATLWRRF